MIEITKEVAYAMNNFYRSSKEKKVEIKNELGEVVDRMLREVPYSGQSIDEEGFMIEDFPDLNCDVEHSVLAKMEQQDIPMKWTGIRCSIHCMRMAIPLNMISLP